jgi:beta-lactamase superfamily II metal-dependent hydrolase
MYNVRFGDAILITVPDRNPTNGRTTKRHILIDVGNAPKVAGSGQGGEDVVFEPVLTDIVEQLDGKRLDLYVMTHEHLDHAQGLFYVAAKLPTLDIANTLRPRHVWLTASAAPDYYDEDKHPEARKQLLAFREMYAKASAFLAASPAEAPIALKQILANNDPTKTSQCVQFLRTMAPNDTHYIHRQSNLAGTHPFREAKLEVWAPEEDTSAYYGRFQPFDAGALHATQAADDDAASTKRGDRRRSHPPQPIPPAGVDVGAFLSLVEARRNGIVDNLLAIDKAANNTSIVFALEWRGWRLLFAGDAEARSWRTMAREGVLKPVHFLKVSHHGSHNGTPTEQIFDSILPSAAPDQRGRHAAISTWTDTYSGIPHSPTNLRLSERASLQSTLDHRDDLFYELSFPG